MRIGVPRETKPGENRVAVTPSAARALRESGAEVLVETGAGSAGGFEDREYLDAGAAVVPQASEAWSADLVVKVKEPLPHEFPFLSESSALFTFLHLAAMPRLTEEFLARRVTAIAYETVVCDGALPILRPMSMVAGILSIQVGARDECGGRARTILSTPGAVACAVKETDLLVSTVLVAGERAPRLVTREMIRTMRPGAVVVDISIDQGGSLETSRPTTHASPYFVEEGVVHYCVTNMPSAVPRTSTQGLVASTLPYFLSFARRGVAGALRSDEGLLAGLNTHGGRITCEGVAKAFGKPFLAPGESIG